MLLGQISTKVLSVSTLALISSSWVAPFTALGHEVLLWPCPSRLSENTDPQVVLLALAVAMGSLWEERAVCLFGQWRWLSERCVCRVSGAEQHNLEGRRTAQFRTPVFITRLPRVCSSVFSREVLAKGLEAALGWTTNTFRGALLCKRQIRGPGAAPDELAAGRASDTNQLLEGTTGIHKYLGTKRSLWSLL